MTPSIMDSRSDRKSKSFLISDILTTSVEEDRKSPKPLASRLLLATPSSWSPMVTSLSPSPSSSSKTTFASLSLVSPSTQSLSSASLLSSSSSYLSRSPGLAFSLSSMLSLLGQVAPPHGTSQSPLVDFKRINLPPYFYSENCRQRIEPPGYLTLETGEQLYKPMRHLRPDWPSVPSSSPSATSDVSTSRRKGGQVRFSCGQSCELERRFEEQKYLSPLDRKKLARCLELSERQVKTWFQNRRAKWRRLKQDGSADFYRLVETGLEVAGQKVVHSESSLMVDGVTDIDVDDDEKIIPQVC